nr:MAG TPA: hypothetical protein [Bacteriophage sp.]
MAINLRISTYLCFSKWSRSILLNIFTTLLIYLILCIKLILKIYLRLFNILLKHIFYFWKNLMRIFRTNMIF